MAKTLIVSPVSSPQAIQTSTANPAMVFLAQLADGPSRNTTKRSLDVIARLAAKTRSDAFKFPWAQLRYEHTQGLRARLAQKFAPSTTNKHLAALRRVLKECWRLGYMSHEEYSRAADIQNVKAGGEDVGQALTRQQVKDMFTHCEMLESPRRERDLALLAVAYGAGLRRSEIAALEVPDFTKNEALIVRHGKGNQSRMVYLSDDLAAFIRDWLDVRGEWEGPLITAVNKHGQCSKRPLTGYSVNQMLQDIASVVGITNFSAHDLRRTFITHLLEAGEDSITVSRLAGHKSTDTTKRYDKRGDEQKKRAAKLLSLKGK